jgi:hypothetical protein
MKHLLYLSATERQLWGKDAQGWQRISGQPQSHVWVVTDFAEESIVEITTPRLFGRDRSAFLERQLANRYPDTPYRALFTPDQEGDPLGWLAPRRQVLFGIDAAARLDTELDATPMSVAGVWPISMLLASLGKQRNLPADLFVVFPGTDVLRIVFLKNRTPILTRLTMTPSEPGAQIDELLRTLRYLENNQIIPRDDRRHSVLLLADSKAYEGPIAATKLDLVSATTNTPAAPADWRFPLFDLALRSPVGQVAPLSRRTAFLSSQVNKFALIAAAAILLAGGIRIGGNLLSIVDLLNQKSTVAATLQQTDIQIAEVESLIRKFNVSPDTVRRAIALYAEEIASLPEMEEHLGLIADVLVADPNLRLKDLQWRLLASGALQCGATPGVENAALPGSNERRVELNFELAVPTAYGPRERALTLRRISAQLAKNPNLTLWQDALKNVTGGSLRGGGAADGGEKLIWCMTLPGKTPNAPPTNTEPTS